MAITTLPDGGTICVSGDITERVSAQRARAETEIKYRKLIEQVAAISYIAEIGVNGQWFYVSPQIETMLGYSAEEWLSNSKDWICHIPIDDHPIVHAAEENSARGEPFQAEYRIIRKDGQTIWVSDTAVVVRGSDSHPVMEGLIVDITDRKMLENQLLQARKMEAVGRLAGGVAHDFNNLLTIIKGYVEMAMQRCLDRPELHSDIRRIEDAADRAVTLVRQLLAFSRKQVLRPKILDLNAIEDFWPQYLLAAEGQQLTNQRDRAIGSIFDAPDIAVQLRPVQAALHSHLHVTFDDGQKIIEIVRYTSRQPAHGLHLARLEQLIFEHFPVGDIDDQALHDGMAVTAAHHDRRVADPNGLSVLSYDAIFGLEGFATCAVLLRGMNDGVIVDGDVTYPIFRIRKPFLCGVAQHGFDLRADVKPLAVDPNLGDVAYGRHLLNELAIFNFGFGTRTLRAHPFGNVAAHANRAAIGQRGNGHLHGDRCSVAVRHGQRPEPFAMLLQGFANLRRYRCHIPGGGNLSPRLAQHRFPICVPDHPRVGRVDINIFPSGIENGQAIDGGIHGQRMRLHGVRAFCLMKLTNCQARGVAHNRNAKK